MVALMTNLEVKCKVEYKGKDGKTRWFWNTGAKRVWEVPLDPEDPDRETLFLLKNRAWVLETFRVYSNSSEIGDYTTVRELYCQPSGFSSE